MHSIKCPFISFLIIEVDVFQMVSPLKFLISPILAKCLTHRNLLDLTILSNYETCINHEVLCVMSKIAHLLHTS
jgi:hypothetical protein